jgi:hypothetical protein
MTGSTSAWRWRCPVIETQLRDRLQASESRVRLAIQALDAYVAYLAKLMLALPIHDAAEVLSRLDRIRTLLSDEEGSHVRP